MRTSPDSLRDDLRALLSDPERRARLGREGRAFAERHHDPREVARTVMDDVLGYRDADYANYKANGGTLTIQQFRPIAPWGKSYHDFGAARDLVFSGNGYMSDADAQNIAGELAPDVGLKWGGLFTNPDPAHFQLDESLAQVQQEWSDYTGGTNLPHQDAPSGLATIALVGAVLALPLIAARRRRSA